MYERIVALFDQGIMTWEEVRIRLGIRHDGPDYAMFNEAWSRAMSELVDECYGDEEDEENEIYAHITPRPPDEETTSERIGVRDGNKGFFKGPLVGMGF